MAGVIISNSVPIKHEWDPEFYSQYQQKFKKEIDYLKKDIYTPN